MMDHRHLRALNQAQKIVLAISKSVSATLSLIASSVVVYKIYLRHKNQRSSPVRSSKSDCMATYYRMLLSISILDIVHSSSSAFSTLAVPKYTNGTFASGNTATCSLQGSLQQLTPTIVLYMATLNTYFMLKIRYNIPDHVIQNRYEVWFHCIPMAHFIGTAITGLSMKIFGPLILPELGCWLDSYCVLTKTCTRSGPIFYNHLDYFLWSFAYIWLFVALIVVIMNSILIYTAIRTQEKRNAKYIGALLAAQKSELSFPTRGSSSLKCSANALSSELFDIVKTKEENHNDSSNQSKSNTVDGKMAAAVAREEKSDLEMIDETEETRSDPNNNIVQWTQDVGGSPVTLPLQTRKRANSIHHEVPTRQSRTAAVQSLLYVSSALFTTIWIFMPWLGYKLQVEARARFFFALMVNIVSPAQGMLNLFIFVRLSFVRIRVAHRDWSLWRCIKTCLFSDE